MPQSQKRICIVTSGHLATCPQMVKAAVFGLMLFWLLRTGGLKLAGITMALGPALIAALAAGAAGEPAGRGLGIRVEGMVRAAVVAVLFGVGYLVILRMLFAEAVRQLMAFVPGVKSSTAF